MPYGNQTPCSAQKTENFSAGVWYNNLIVVWPKIVQLSFEVMDPEVHYGHLVAVAVDDVILCPETAL